MRLEVEYTMYMESIDILIGLHIGVAVVLLIILYHILFAVVSLRRVTRRIDTATKNVEQLVIKPMAIVDSILQTVQSVKKQAAKVHKKKA